MGKLTHKGRNGSGNVSSCTRDTRIETSTARHNRQRKGNRMPAKIRRPTRYRIFYDWLQANRSRFIFQPRVSGGRVVSRREMRKVQFHLDGVVDGVTCTFSDWGIDIFYYSDGVEWDRLWAFHLSEDRFVWHGGRGARERFWSEGCFEPFLRWCNGPLATASHLEVFKLTPGTIEMDPVWHAYALKRVMVIIQLIPTI